MLRTFCFLLMFLSFSCASKKFSTNGSYYQRKDYQQRTELGESFLKRSAENLTEEEIQKLLTSKVRSKSSIKLAVLKLSHTGTDHWLGKQAFALEQSIDENNIKVFEDLKKAKMVKDIAIIPSFLRPGNPTLASLRDSAALVQADYLLLIKTMSRSDYDFNVFSEDVALSNATLEAAIMDVSTAVVPYTALITGKVKIKKSDKVDFNSNEFRIRSRKEAEDEALKNLSADLINFFEKF